MATFFNPYTYIGDPTRGRPLFNGFVYFGMVDRDPTNPADQIEAQVICECGGQPVNISQPIRTGPGGVALYQGSPAQIHIQEAEYSLTIQNQNGELVYHSPRVTTVDDLQGVIDLTNQFNDCTWPRFRTGVTYKKGVRVLFNDGTTDDVYEKLTNTGTDLPTVEASWRKATLTDQETRNDERYLQQGEFG